MILLPLLGLTWVFGLFAVNENTAVFAWLFTIFNSLQVNTCIYDVCVCLGMGGDGDLGRHAFGNGLFYFKYHLLLLKPDAIFLTQGVSIFVMHVIRNDRVWKCNITSSYLSSKSTCVYSNLGSLCSFGD